jgi:DNA repair protein RecO (recombination protein O)
LSELTPAFVLHARDYRDTSLLIEFLTPSAGRISAVAKGVRRVSHGVSQRAILQPLQPLWIDCGGRGELKTLRHAEVRDARMQLHGHALFSALYLNELLCRLLHRDDAHADLFLVYESALQRLAGAEPLDITLRLFELRLLEELGYGFDFAHAGEEGAPVRATMTYRFDRGRGLIADADGDLTGGDLLDFAAGRFSDAARRTLKRLCRQALQPHLGDKPLQSRLLFSADR